MIVCKKCGVEKSEDEFYKNSGNKSGYLSACKGCVAVYQKSVRPRNRMQEAERYRKDEGFRRSKVVRARNRRKENPNRVKEHNRISKLKTTYGLTVEDVKRMHAAQNGSCAICKDRIPPAGKNCNVDHCHNTGCVRGLLCRRCNLGLGLFRDNLVILQESILYLEESRGHA
jgi:hypothetical protein